MVPLSIILTILATIGLVGQFVVDRVSKKEKSKKIIGLILVILGSIGVWGSYKTQNDSNNDLIEKIVEGDSIQKILVSKLNSSDSAQKVRDSEQKFRDNEQKLRDAESQVNRLTLLSKIDSLNYQLKPFVITAQEKFPQLNSEAALTMLAKDIEHQNKRITALQYYSDVAQLGIDGTTGTAGVGLIETTPISVLMKKTLNKVDDRYEIKCDSESIAIFKEVITKFPRFPFSYYALAICYRSNSNKAWREYAMQSIDIFSNTTSLAGHHGAHDEALKNLLRYIKN
jgi:hypothetical protein